MCNSCNTCGEYIADNFGNADDLQEYQKQMLKAKDLDRYDLFYRMVGVPFIELEVEDFFSELNELLDIYRVKCEKDEKMGNLDNIPYV